METETRTDITADHFGGFVVDTDRQVIRLTEAELRGVVQAAYDQLGLMAEPSLLVEAARSATLVADLEADHRRALAAAGWSA